MSKEGDTFEVPVDIAKLSNLVVTTLGEDEDLEDDIESDEVEESEEDIDDDENEDESDDDEYPEVEGAAV